ncbi:bifunctional diaminohydroxyphosphoribosylaminopyrimidine deaminase/5-amino-6-(5-phosphoribosylamino)uracil reductase RibD [Putridiphycobacter roseus]|uniref:Riboflavin biosynthesis protein RibD n=1 Tax=Putridiphycobacter roseus TaxID=2219161 RepID=A0A2W1N276_9FLAO|nr:bifunctional diaminohydroxyphosphoribosylaminopyrimidine deaminase/5-amino-6-(5-phosphoribosylamino)uracil reductase RibD [Putridiphycobacter roseus]PZE17924.1 bifunctional diaminohydroxyphosphoribosylaminopyrimidine deaminase/5-amino-6-(5-phosphoribosylamino)uracil reductase RibD [Putridiphycobacter roseus]
MSTDEQYLFRCLALAKLGIGYAAPNPLVGSVVVHQGKIIGEGYHQKYGEAHAEVNAIAAVTDKSLLAESTIYVNLEPCAHFGKTPPCANLIIDSKIPKVVIGCVDPYAEVAGKGIERLRNAGIEVIVGVLEKESQALNKRFFTFHAKKRPYLILKWAQSANGMIDMARDKEEKGIFWITQPETKTLVHQWRAEEAGILVGRKTIVNDNPALTTRVVAGPSPIRIVIDPNCQLNVAQYQINDGAAKTYVFNSIKSGKVAAIEYIQVKPFSLENIVATLYTLNIQSVIVEGGKHTLNTFIDAALWDEARILTGISVIKEGILAPRISNFTRVHKYFFGKDEIQIIQR